MTLIGIHEKKNHNEKLIPNTHPQRETEDSMYAYHTAALSTGKILNVTTTTTQESLLSSRLRSRGRFWELVGWVEWSRFCFAELVGLVH